MMTQDKEEVWQKKFNMLVLLRSTRHATVTLLYSCAEYFNGRTSLEEMQYKTGLDRRDIRQVLTLFKEEVRECAYAKFRTRLMVWVACHLYTSMICRPATNVFARPVSRHPSSMS